MERLKDHSRQGHSKVTGHRAIGHKAEVARGQNLRVEARGRDHKVEAASNLKILTSHRNKINHGLTNHNKTNHGQRATPISLLMQLVSGRHSSKGHRGHQGHSARTGQGHRRAVLLPVMRRRRTGRGIFIYDKSKERNPGCALLFYEDFFAYCFND